jgi:hypothetical protein
MGWKLAVYIFLIVITDPYKSIKYDQINSYDIDNSPLEDVITVHYPESEYSDDSSSRDEEDCGEEGSDDSYIYKKRDIPWWFYFANKGSR